MRSRKTPTMRASPSGPIGRLTLVLDVVPNTPPMPT